MTALIQPFRGLRPIPERAEEVSAPPYDVLNSTEALALAADRPWSFLHISKAEIDLPEHLANPYHPNVYAKAAENMQAMLAAGVLKRDQQASYYVYRLTAGTHQQTGLVATVAVAHYRSNRVRRHELTMTKKEDGRLAQIEAVNAQTGPVLLAYPEAANIDALLADAARTPPETVAVGSNQAKHEIWALTEPETIRKIGAAFDAVPALYIADGHHRSAAAARVADKRGPHASSDYFLSVIFPHHQLQILPYNRVIRDLNKLSAPEVLQRLAACFTVSVSADPVQPQQRGEFGLYVNGSWHHLRLSERLIDADDPIARLPVSLLDAFAIAPVFGIHDSRNDDRIDFVGGIRGCEYLMQQVDCGEMAAAFVLPATTMEELMAVADAGAIMPPKSTWFEPKLADGLVSHVLD